MVSSHPILVCTFEPAVECTSDDSDNESDCGSVQSERRRPKARPGSKPYQKYMRRALAESKEEHPNMSAIERMRHVVLQYTALKNQGLRLDANGFFC